MQRFVQFVNLDIDSTAQVEQLFSEAAMVAGTLMRIPADESDAYRRDQAAMRAVVQPLADAFGSRTRRARVARQLVPAVQGELGHMLFPARFGFDGKQRLQVAYTLTGVQACCWVAVGLLVDAERGLRGRFGRCGFCGRFTLTYERKPRRHCSDDHAERFRRKTGAARVARHRARERQRRLSRQKES